MPNPLEALKKASSIGADPRDKLSGVPVTASVMPMLPPAGAFGGLVDALKRAAFPSPVSEASTLGPAQETLGEVDPSHTPVGGEGLYNVGRTVLKSGGEMADAALRYLRKP